MDTDTAYLAELAGNPDDDVLRIRYATSLAQRGDPRAEILHLELFVRGLTVQDESFEAMNERLEHLQSGADPAWLAGVARREPDRRDTAGYARFHAEANTYTSDDRTFASDPGMLTLSDAKLGDLRPDLCHGFFGAAARGVERFAPFASRRVYLSEHIRHGDSRAAVVLSTEPLLVAAYSDELDCIALLRFPSRMAEQYDLAEGSRLLTVNRYQWRPRQRDLRFGPHSLGNYLGFEPMIGDFLSDDLKRIEARKREITNFEWGRAYALGKRYLLRFAGRYRDGCPGHSAAPAPWYWRFRSA